MPWVEMEPPLQRGGSAREQTTVVATMVTRAEGRDEAAYIRMTTNWVRQLEYHGIPRESLLILVTSDVATKNLEAINALKTVVKVMPSVELAHHYQLHHILLTLCFGVAAHLSVCLRRAPPERRSAQSPPPPPSPSTAVV